MPGDDSMARTKTLYRQMRLHQTNKFLHSKGNNQQNEKATYGMGENICKSDKRSVSKIRNVYNSEKKNTNNPIKMANRHMKKCLTSLIIREMQIQTTVRYHLTHVRMAIIKKSKDN